MKEISQEEWREQIAKDENAVILDVRTEQEVEEGYIPGAKVIDIYQAKEFIDEIDKLDKGKKTTTSTAVVETGVDKPVL